MLRYLVIVFAGMLLLPLVSSAQCLTTLPPNPSFVPSAPYPATPSNGLFWYGTDVLWTALNFDGKWGGFNKVPKGRAYFQKLIFWRKGCDWHTEIEPRLIVTGKRLDGDAPAIAVAHANAVFVTSNTPAMMTGINIPTVGCWELTAHYAGHTLTFVVSVEP